MMGAARRPDRGRRHALAMGGGLAVVALVLPAVLTSARTSRGAAPRSTQTAAITPITSIAPSSSALVAATSASASPSAASSSSLASPAGNLEISADLLEVDTREQTATLSGKVHLTRGTREGDLSLKCPKITVRYEASGPRVSWAKGTGGVVVDVRGIRGEAPEFELDLDKQRLALRGGVRLFRGVGWVTADGADIDLATARITMSNVKASLPVGGALKKP